MIRISFILLLAFSVWACTRKPNRPDYGTNSGNGYNPVDGEDDSEIQKLKLAPTVFHRLNRFEYNNTVADVFGMDLGLAYDFPEDPVTHGFDNMGENLSMSPALSDLFSQASQKIAKKVVDDHPRGDIDIDPAVSGKGQGGEALGRQWSIEGTMNNKFTLENDENMTFSVLIGAEAYRCDTPKMIIKLDETTVADQEVKAESNYPDTISFKANLTKGEHNISITFSNPCERSAVTGNFNYLVLSRISGKSEQYEESQVVQQMSACGKSAEPVACKQNLYYDIAKKAWRRSLSATEKKNLNALWTAAIAAKGSESDAMRAVISGITLSAKFLFRTDNPVTAGKTKAELDDYSIASRLSYFLWSSVPDQTLLSVAEKKQLRDKTVLKAQIKRMLADPKAHRFVKNFAEQWLFTRPLDKVERDSKLYPTYSGGLKNSMASESELVFGDFLTNGKDINDLLSPGFTFADDKLAKHYGLTPPGSNEPKKIVVSNNQRGGVLTHAAWLTVTSQTDDTVPVKRGVWAIENLLCRALQSPPAVPPLPKDEANSTKKTSVRDKFLVHLTAPNCAACHNIIDPIGFAFEAFDPTGATRTMDVVGKPVDTKGNIYGKKFDDIPGMINVLKEENQFRKCLTKKLYSYALGRSAEEVDTEMLDAIADEMESSGATLEDAIEYIVLSPAFRMADFSEDLRLRIDANFSAAPVESYLYPFSRAFCPGKPGLRTQSHRNALSFITFRTDVTRTPFVRDQQGPWEHCPERSRLSMDSKTI